VWALRGYRPEAGRRPRVWAELENTLPARIGDLEENKTQVHQPVDRHLESDLLDNNLEVGYGCGQQTECDKPTG